MLRNLDHDVVMKLSACVIEILQQEKPNSSKILLTLLKRILWCLFCVAYSISSVAYYPARVGNVLGSEHIYGGGLPLPSFTNSLYLGPGRI